MRRAEGPMASYHIRKYQEGDRDRVLELFRRGMDEHIPATFRHMLTLPRFLLLLLGAPLAIVLVSGSWLLATASVFALLLALRLLARQPWKKYVATCLQTDMADITKSYLSSPDSCFWVAESGGQVVGTVCALPVKEPPLGRKQLQLFRMSVSSQHRGRGIAKALVRTVLQFARDRGFGEVVLDTSVIQHSAVGLYQAMGFRNTGKCYIDTITRLLDFSVLHFVYPLPSAEDRGL